MHKNADILEDLQMSLEWDRKYGTIGTESLDCNPLLESKLPAGHGPHLW